MKRLLLLAIPALVGILALAAPAVAAPPVENVTENFHHEANTFYDISFCDETQAWEINEVGTGVFHLTVFPNGTYHVTGTFLGKVEILPIENELVETEDGFVPVGAVVYVEDAETFTGRYTQWFGENGNTKNINGTFTFNVTLFGSEGTVLHVRAVAHFTVNASGDLVVEFENFTVIGCS